MDIACFFSPDDNNVHAIVATIDGDVYDTFYNILEMIPYLSLLGNFPGVTKISAFYAADDAHIKYNDKTDPEDGLPDEDVNAIDEIPVYSINKPKEESLAIPKILSSNGSQKMMKKNRLLEQLEEIRLVDINLSGAVKHSRLKGLLNPISVAGWLDSPLVEVEYKGSSFPLVVGGLI